jgi:putative component of toxin-antitoxin plasmid stabilization module
MAYSSKMTRSLAPRLALRRLRFALIGALAFGLACGEGDGRPASLEAWQAQRSRLDESVWANERLAQEYEQSLVALWDALLAADRRGDPAAKADVLARVALERITLGKPGPVEALDHGIERFALAEPKRNLNGSQWSAFVHELAAGGYQLVQSEWHHASFEPPQTGAPARSLVSIVLHVIAAAGERRITVEGNLAVEWSSERDEHDHFAPTRVDATGLEMFVRNGPPAFERIFSERSPRRPDPYAGIHPLLLYDLDRDGLVDVVMLRSARVLWNRGGGEFEAARLLERPYLLTEAGVVADFDGDGHPDILSSRARGDLVLYSGDERGRFSGEPQAIAFDELLRGPSVLTTGDVDADGDLDVWVGQYKPAYAEGQMPSPFYDANDGYPSYLLLNDGDGNWTPATVEAGLGAKRFRRTYASSFVDLDSDGDLDLLVVSDYAGVDLYHNDGTGRFTDANDTLRGDRHLFGMSAAFADYDLDGRLDLFVAGMGSTTARRLEALGLARADRPEVTEMRMRMGFGNRLYVARDEGWYETDFANQVARTGWTWGTTAFDFDNDGDSDLFAANGHQSGESTEDYCSNFWSHDLYDGASEPDPALASLFAEESQGLRSGEESWDGYQKNHLLMNRRGEGFVDVAFLLGVADQFDSRSAVSADLDRDGRVDLLVTEHLGAEGENLHIYRNRLDTGNAWIGVELREQGNGVSPVGASVTVRTNGRTHIGRVVTGETLMGQHATTLHFGLGEADRVETIEVRWLNGATRILRAPEPNRYHLVQAPSGAGVPEVLDASLEVPADVLRGPELFEALLSELPELSEDTNRVPR